VGWKGLINDPDLDGSFQINKGLRLARELLMEINEAGLPAGTEFLDMISPQYYADLVSWGAIGARTTESQVHRELASGLSCAVGFKNGTDGNVRIAVDALKAARTPTISSPSPRRGTRRSSRPRQRGLPHHPARSKHPNYDAASVDAAAKELAASGLEQRLMVDCSHANSQKMYQRQIDVAREVARQIATGEDRVIASWWNRTSRRDARISCRESRSYTARASPTPASAGGQRAAAQESRRSRAQAPAGESRRILATTGDRPRFSSSQGSRRSGGIDKRGLSRCSGDRRADPRVQALAVRGLSVHRRRSLFRPVG